MTTTRTFVGPDEPFRSTVTLPGDKSLSHRALVLAAMAPGKSHIARLGPGADIASTVTCLRCFGVVVDGTTVRSRGVGGWEPSVRMLDAGNSASTLRMIAGAAAGRPFTTVLGGDASLLRRPMRRLAEPLAALGAAIVVSEDGTAPVTVRGAALRGAQVTIPVASAQVRTAFAFAALQADGESGLDSPPGFRDHTERWLTALGLGTPSGPTAFRIRPGIVPELELSIPGDPSSAGFLWAAAALTPSRVTTPGVSLNPGRIGLLEVIAAMGASVEIATAGDILGDPVGTVTVQGPVLRGTRVTGALTVRTLDELPLVGVLAAVAEGETTVTGARELRAKESDRIAATVALVTALGGSAEASADGFSVRGSGLCPGLFDAGGDHRMAMSAAVAATAAGTVRVIGVETAAVSWPGFAETLERVWSSR